MHTSKKKKKKEYCPTLHARSESRSDGARSQRTPPSNPPSLTLPCPHQHGQCPPSSLTPHKYTIYHFPVFGFSLSRYIHARNLDDIPGHIYNLQGRREMEQWDLVEEFFSRIQDRRSRKIELVWVDTCAGLSVMPSRVAFLFLFLFFMPPGATLELFLFYFYFWSVLLFVLT